MGLVKLISNNIALKWKQTFNDNVDYLENLEKNLDEQHKSTNSRIDNLVLHSGGDSPNEVVDARVNNKGETFDTLQGRLSAAENQSDERITQIADSANNNKEQINQLNKTIRELYNGSGSEVSIFVSADKGNDAIAEGTEEKPFKTIQMAINAIPLLSSIATTVFVDDGVYLEDVRLSGNIVPRITLRTVQNIQYDDVYNAKLPVKIRSISVVNCNANIQVYGIQFIDQANTAASRFPHSIEIRDGGMLVVQRCSFAEDTRKLENHATVYSNGNSKAHVMESLFNNQNTVFYTDTPAEMRVGGNNKGTGNNLVYCAENATLRSNVGVSGTQETKIIGQGLIIAKGMVLN
ncbi:hypothetical protein [Enterococcus lactis]|uniref:hypothetical protein n=1 Tax=Enterococcus lactis TaxID=357441 RepID=UPI001A05FE5D|nr:hypothetical protein [Enterococcus lactis]EMF0288701.1 hypothetical protein [Enterococcus faecium]MDT2803201.1 hypothetical protein [Enterococcus lactis]